MTTPQIPSSIGLAQVQQEFGMNTNANINGNRQLSLDDPAIRRLAARTGEISFSDLGGKYTRIRAQTLKYGDQSSNHCIMALASDYLILWVGDYIGAKNSIYRTYLAFNDIQSAAPSWSGILDYHAVGNPDMTAVGSYVYLVSFQTVAASFYHVLCKIDLDWNIAWQTCWQVSINDPQTSAIAVSSNNDFCFVAAFDRGIFLTGINSSGSIVFSKQIYDSRNTNYYFTKPCMVCDSSGNLYMSWVNSSSGQSTMTRRFFLTKWDQSGNPLFTRSWSDSTGNNISTSLAANDIKIDASGNIWVTGQYATGPITIKFDSSGNKLIERSHSMSQTFGLGWSIAFDDQSQAWVSVANSDTRGFREYHVLDLELNLKRTIRQDQSFTSYFQHNVVSMQSVFRSPYIWTHIRRQDGSILERIKPRAVYTATVDTISQTLPPNRNSAIRMTPRVSISQEPWELTEYTTSTTSNNSGLFSNLLTSGQFTYGTTASTTVSQSGLWYFQTTSSYAWSQVHTDIEMSPAAGIRPTLAFSESYANAYSPIVGYTTSSQNMYYNVANNTAGFRQFKATNGLIQNVQQTTFGDTLAGTPVSFTSNSPAPVYIKEIVSGYPGLTVMVAGTGQAYDTTNWGTTWTFVSGVYARTKIATNGTQGMVGVWLSSGNIGRTTGGGWTTNATGMSTPVVAVGHNGSVFLAIGSDGQHTTSSDGVTWSSVLTGAPSNVNGLAWGGTKYVAIAGSNSYTSTIGYGGWSQSGQPNSSQCWDIAYNSVLGLYMAVGIQWASISSDGVTWTDITSEIVNSQLYNDAYWMSVEPITNLQISNNSSPNGLTKRNGFIIGARSGVAYTWLV